jgi:hypothetical protein
LPRKFEKLYWYYWWKGFMNYTIERAQVQWYTC